MTSILSSTFGTRSSFQSGNDFHQHSVHVKRRVAKLKKDLKIQVKDTKHYQDKNKVYELDASQYESDERFGLVLLYLAERDLSRALEVNTVSEVSSSRSKEKFIISKLKRSLQYIKQLIDISFNEASQSKKIEVYVYHGLVQGLLGIKQKKWGVASYALSIARNALEFLETFSEFGENKSSHLYRELIESFIDPSLKLTIAHSSLGNSKKQTSDLNILSKIVIKHYRSSGNPPDDIYDDLIELIGQTDKSYVELSSAEEEAGASSRLIDHVQWTKYTAKLYNSDIARQIMEVQSKEQKDINDSDISSFDPVLLGWQEALETHEADNERVQSLGVEDPNENRDRQIVLTFIRYNLLFVKLRRDGALIAELNKKKLKHSTSLVDINKDILRIYDIILQTVLEIKDLPGVYSDEDLYGDIETLESYFQALKYETVAKIYEIIKKHKQSLLILSNIFDKLNSLKQLLTEFPGHGNVLSNSKLQQITKRIASTKVKTHVLAQFEHEFAQNQSSSNGSVADAINDIVPINTVHEIKKPGKIIDIDHIKPVSLKPVFFDLAFNYIGETEENATYRVKEPAVGVNSGVTSTANSTGTANTSEKGENKQKKKGLFGLWG